MPGALFITILLLELAPSTLSRILKKSSKQIPPRILVSSNFLTQIAKFSFIWVIQVFSGHVK